MTDVQKDIVKWLHTQPDWLQEAAERLLEQGALNEEAVGQCAERLKSLDGQKVTKHRSFRRLGGVSLSSMGLKIDSIGDIQGIENLSPRKPLDFGSGNLTVIYGHNGSGKSGYTRILKKVCGKPRAVDLKPNVFKKPPANCQCGIAYSLGGVRQTVTWVANSEAVDDLRSVDIFDGDAAGFYLSGESEVSYIPPAVALFEQLARTCDRVKGALQVGQDRLVSKLPAIPGEYADTPAGKSYQTLKPGQSEGSLQPLLEWNGSDQKALDQLMERLRAVDLASLAKQKRSRKREVEAIAGALQQAATAVGGEACKQLQALRQIARDQRRRATEAAETKTASAQLEGIGADTWRALWDAAKAFSVERAYPSHAYPFIGAEARCVLCHQTLDSDAKKRLQDFEAYVQGKMEADAKAAEEAYSRALGTLPVGPSENDIQTQSQAAGLSEEGWLGKLNGFWREYRKRRDAIKLAESNEKISGVEAPADLIAGLNTLSQALETEAAQHEVDAKGFDHAEVLKQKTQLEAKRWTSQQAMAIRAEIARLEGVSRFEEWKRLTNTRNLSLKAGEISGEVITDAYVERFNNELRALGAARIQVELVKTRTERGKVKHQIQLRGVTARSDAPGLVLSDGERRVVALATFLADVTGKPQRAPFVFDDPISSLDHDFEWQVAMRLTKLAADRQVLVFTHRLSLFGALEDAARKCGEGWKNAHFHQLYIEAFSGTAGHPVDEYVWTAKTKKANNLLIARLDEAKKFWDSEQSENYKIHAQAICTDFRKLLERTVEDDLLGQVVKRHRRSITTDNRITQLPKITNEDCNFIDELMTKYSCYEHSQSDEAPTFLPNEPELRQDIEALKEWRETFSDRVVGVKK